MEYDEIIYTKNKASYSLVKMSHFMDGGSETHNQSPVYTL